MLDWPVHSQTSPMRTSVSVSVVAPSEIVTLQGALLATNPKGPTLTLTLPPQSFTVVEAATTGG